MLGNDLGEKFFEEICLWKKYMDPYEAIVFNNGF